MDTKLQKKLFAKYHGIFREHKLSMDKTYMCWGIKTGNGWYNILDDLCRHIEIVEEASGLQVIARQVKEKYGALRFYFCVDVSKSKIPKKKIGDWEEIICALVERAENRSRQTCELCGNPVFSGLSCLNGWYACLCERCLKKNKAYSQKQKNRCSKNSARFKVWTRANLLAYCRRKGPETKTTT